MVDDMVRKYGMIQADQEKLTTWQEVTRIQLDKYYGQVATDGMLRICSVTDGSVSQSERRASRSA